LHDDLLITQPGVTLYPDLSQSYYHNLVPGISF